MAKQDFQATMELQNLKNANSLLETQNREYSSLINELKKEKKAKDQDINIMNVDDVVLDKNVRDDEFNYQYEEVDTLAKNIEKKGQLQPVLVSLDGTLLTGYRRRYAIKFLKDNGRGNGDILVYRYPKKIADITRDEITEIQIAENDQRREIDNFQLAKLFKRMIDEGSSQAQLAERFNKSRSLVSMIMSINNIDLILVDYLKQFQVFGWSIKKFNALNSSKALLEEDGNFNDYDLIAEKELRKYEKLRGTIGILPLNQIASYDELPGQIRAFIKIYVTRLSDEEKASKEFKRYVKELMKDNAYKPLFTAKKAVNTLRNIFTEISDTFSEDEYKLVSEMIESIGSLVDLKYKSIEKTSTNPKKKIDKIKETVES